jgi:transcriptional regulator with XRE-family HTH domain
MNELCSLLGANVRAMRHAQAISLRELSRKSGVPPSVISRVENGCSTTVPTLGKLAGALGIEPGQLLRQLLCGHGLLLAGDCRECKEDETEEEAARVDHCS